MKIILVDVSKKNNGQFEFEKNFGLVHDSLKSYLYRLLTKIEDTEDMLHDTFIRAREHYDTFDPDKGSFKTWVFTIAHNLSMNFLRRKQRWTVDCNERAKQIVQGDSHVSGKMKEIMGDPNTTFEIREHINYCFNCMGRTLPLDQQVALILKDIYAFKVKEIARIMGKSHGVVKHVLVDARKTMVKIFDHRCSLINKDGVCHKCSELSGAFNPKQMEHEQLMKIRIIKNAGKEDNDRLLKMRTELIKSIDFQTAKGRDFHEFLYTLNELGQQQDN